MIAKLGAAGWRLEAEPQQADTVVINTCAFIDPAKEESTEVILEHAARKQRETSERAALADARLFDVFPQSEMQHGLSFADEADNLALESLFMNVA